MRLSGSNHFYGNVVRRLDRRHVHHARGTNRRATKRNLASNAQAIALAALSVVVVAASACSKSGSGAATVAITNVSVIDVRSGSIKRDFTVVVTGDRIAYAGPAASTPPLDNATVINGAGKFLLPGLWDM